MKHPFIKLCSMILVLAMLFGMFPMESLAEEYKNTPLSEAQTASTTTVDSYVVEEVVEKRSEYIKHYKMSNGLYVAAVYAEPIHYEENGNWADIDNTLTLKNGAYINTAGIWDVSFPQQLSKNTKISVTKDGYTLSFGMAGELRQNGNLEVMSAESGVNTASMITGISDTVEITTNGVAQTFAVSGAQASIAQIQTVDYEQPEDTHEEMILDKLSSRLQYANVYSNTDVLYDLSSNQVKESIIMEQYSSTLRGYQYHLDVGDMIPVLDDEGQVLFYDAQQEGIVMVMAAPFLVDADLQFSYDVQVSLRRSGTGYMLTYLLPQSWLADSSRAWPVILDPVVKPTLTLSNVQDQTVMSKKEKEYTWGMVQAGYYSTEGITRFYLMYNNLPTLTSADVIVDAKVKLYKPQTSTISSPVQVHKVKTTWQHDNLQWSNKPDYYDNIEDSLTVKNTGFYEWDITDIVRDWYVNENTGMMFKCPDSVENEGSNNFKQFYSSNYGVNRASLEIEYRNNNGIEDRWDYTVHSAGRAGVGYINNYTGNLVWTRSDIGFDGNRVPVSISHVYNANDRTNNLFGMGNGWRTTYNQRVYQWDVDSSYYIWEDSDGTSHYFKYISSGKYVDEDNPDLTLTTTGSGAQTYCISSRSGAKSYFDANHRLTSIVMDQETDSSATITYTTTDGYLISTITDGAGRLYQFWYSNNLLTKISFKGTNNKEHSFVSFGYTGSNLTSVTDKDGKTSKYTYDNNLLKIAEDIDGYKLKYTYNSIGQNTYQPYRVISVAEYDGSIAGGSLSIEYAQNQTTFTDHNGHIQIMQFNDLGNPVSIQDGEGHAQFAEYALNNDKEIEENSDPTKKTNQMTLNSKLQNTVVNLIQNTGFELTNTWTTVNSSASQAIGSTAYMGDKALALTTTAANSGVQTSFTAAAGESYTFSAYVKTGSSGKAYLALYDGGTPVISEKLAANSDWTRLQVTYTNTSASGKNVNARFMLDAAGTAYIDCVQVEKAVTASRYNLVENGDFRFATGWSSTSGKTSLPADTVTVKYRNAQPPQLSDDVYQFDTALTSTNRISQTVKVSGKAGDTFVLGGWARGDSTPLESVADRTFSLIAIFVYADGDGKAQRVDFNPDVDSTVSWQYAAGAVEAEKDYSAIKLVLAYDYNANTAYFDGIQLFKESFGIKYKYDENGNIQKATDLDGSSTEYDYDNNNNLTQIKENGEVKATYTYDAYHNVLSTTTSDGLTYTYTYDTYGNNLTVSTTADGLTMTASSTYTDGNLPATTTNAAGNTTIYTYDPQTSVLISVQYPNGAGTKTQYEYDDMYRPELVTANTGSQTLSASYAYTDDFLTGITTGTTTYNFEYGDFGLRSSVEIGSVALATYSYTSDPNKYLKKITYGNENFTNYDYDDYGRVTKETFEDGDTVTYKYDNDGALATLTDSGSGRTTTYYYDLTNRLMKYVESGSGYSHSVGYTYDDLSNLTDLVETINGVTHTTGYAYDDEKRVTSVTNGSSVESYSYDTFGRNTSRVTKNGGTTVLTDTIGYRSPSSGKTSAQVATLKNAATGYNTTYTYTYDANGNIKTVKEGNYTTTYTYDNQNQLTREDNQRAGKSWTWTYDKAGNISSKKEYAYTTGTLGTATSTKSYSYDNGDWGDRLIAYNGKTISSDPIGNMTGDGTWTYTWEHGRELATMSSGGTTWTFTYDADGMRTKRTNGSTTYSYVYNGSQLSQMTVGSNTLYFAYDAAGTPMSVTYNGNAYYYVTNLQGDITAILSSAGTAVVTYSYDAWGKLLGTDGSMENTLGVHNPLRYRGYVYDTETGLYYLQSRYYDPEVGRFINADNYPTTGQGLTGNNMFAYCGNNPVVRTDTQGECWHLVVGAIVGAASQYVSDVVSNLASGKSFTESLVPTSSAIDYLAAAASGALAASGIGALGSAVVNAAIDGVAYIANCGINGEEISGTELLFTVTTSALTSGKGVDGANLRGVYKRSKQILKTAISPKKIAMYTAKKKEVVTTVIGEISMSLLEGVKDGFNRDTRRRLNW